MLFSAFSLLLKLAHRLIEEMEQLGPLVIIVIHLSFNTFMSVELQLLFGNLFLRPALQGLITHGPAFHTIINDVHDDFRASAYVTEGRRGIAVVDSLFGFIRQRSAEYWGRTVFFAPSYKSQSLISLVSGSRQFTAWIRPQP